MAPSCRAGGPLAKCRSSPCLWALRLVAGDLQTERGNAREAAKLIIAVQVSDQGQGHVHTGSHTGGSPPVAVSHPARLADPLHFRALGLGPREGPLFGSSPM